MDVESIIVKWLKQNKCDGLCNEDCGCPLDDLAPCLNLSLYCVPAIGRILGKDEYLGDCGPGDFWLEPFNANQSLKSDKP